VSVARPYRTRVVRPADLTGHRRSHAAIPVAVVLVLVGLYLGTVWLVLTVLVGFVLLVSSGSLLSTRLNPLSPTFYLPKKPSFLAIGVVFLGAVILFAGAYYLWVHHLGPVVPHF
jgi:hypothetical protein